MSANGVRLEKTEMCSPAPARARENHARRQGNHTYAQAKRTIRAAIFRC